MVDIWFMGVSMAMGVPPNRRFLLGNIPLKGMIWGYPYIRKPWRNSEIPSGKHPKNDGHSPFLNGKIKDFDWAIFNSELLV